jgi:hypothetical protein
MLICDRVVFKADGSTESVPKTSSISIAETGYFRTLRCPDARYPFRPSWQVAWYPSRPSRELILVSVQAY